MSLRRKYILSIDENILVKDLKEQNILVSKGKAYYYDNSLYKKGIKIRIGCTDAREINRGFEIIEEQIKKYTLK